MKMTKDYTREIRGWKIVFWVSLLFSTVMFIIVLLYPDTSCYSDICLYLFFKIFPIFIGVTIACLPIFFINKNFTKVRNASIFFFLLLVLNSMRAPAYDDFLAVGPKPTYIYIYILEFVFAIYILIKNRK